MIEIHSQVYTSWSDTEDETHDTIVKVQGAADGGNRESSSESINSIHRGVTEVIPKNKNLGHNEGENV